MSALAELLHNVVDLLPFHEQSRLESAHALVNEAEKELGLHGPSEPVPDEPAQAESEKTVENTES